MMSFTTFTTIFSTLKAAGDLTGNLLTLKETADFGAKIIQLQGMILSAQNIALDAQAEQNKLDQKIKELSTQVAELKSWKQEKERYQLQAVAPQVFAYVLKQEYSGPDPVHWLCCNCFNEGSKSILQFSRNVIAGNYYFCQRCKNEICLPNPSNTPSIRTAKTEYDPLKGW